MYFFKFILWTVVGLSISSTQIHAQTDEPYYCAKVMSYNILNTIYEPASNPWSIRKQLVFDVISETTPDLIAFQEDSVEQVDDLEAQFSEYEIVRAPISIPSQATKYRLTSGKSIG